VGFKKPKNKISQERNKESLPKIGRLSLFKIK
jgi:hypothetical protein